MHIDTPTREMVLNADSKALASYGTHGLNVVPVSTIRVLDDTIQLMNYFMGKTLENIHSEPKVSLTCWSGLTGCQIKGSVVYHESGDVFDEADAWITENVANRTLKGVLIITPLEVHTVTPDTGGV